MGWPWGADPAPDEGSVVQPGPPPQQVDLPGSYLAQPVPLQAGQGSCSGTVITLPFLMRVFWMTFHDVPLQAGQGCRDGRVGFGIAGPFGSGRDRAPGSGGVEEG
ncbi:hypothetical protein HDA44_005792 [Kribbella solani]|uniref:Uncharacterized protein n=1 Tax=Kribbella solani TaxID=236067 RepID=A0A841DWV6_9ACTN|nr:hypothetical protein [Kribbella solani]